MNEDVVVKEINRLERYPHRVADLLTNQEEERLRQVLPVENLEGLKKGFTNNPEVVDDLIKWAEDEVAARNQKKALEKLERQTARGTNRSLYVPTPIIRAYDFYDEKIKKSRVRIQHKHEVRCAGLLDQMIQNLCGLQTIPVGMYFQDESKKGMPPEAWDVVSQVGLRSSKAKLLWNTRSPAWPLLLKTFPVAGDLLAYGHSLMSPLVPHGYVPNCPVTFRKLKDEQGTPLGTDGSGIYHPDAPQMSTLMARYGAVAMQFRYMNIGGVFAKGMLFPSELAVDTNGSPTVVMDWLQIKGLKKETAKIRYEQDEAKDVLEHGHLGIFRVRRRATSMASCFECLENVALNDRARAIIKKRVEKAVQKILDRGPTALLKKIESKDENVKHMVRIIRTLAETGEEISPMQVDRIRKAVKSALGGELYRISHGGGIQFRAHEARMDNTVPKGTCVVSGLPAGLNVACIRYPTVLSQGLTVLKSTHPRQHHLCKGELAPGVIIMNPQDLVTRMQGDDDGDWIGISTESDVVELFRQLVDQNVYHIETVAKRVETPTDSPEGEALMRVSQRGEVDMLTIMRTQLLAVGDVAGANAIAISIQEAVDRAKKIVQYSDFRKAASLVNWIIDENGEYHFSHKLPVSITPIGVFPIKLAQDWVGQRLIRAGCYRENQFGTIVPANPLTWRQKSKTINLDEWQPTKHRNTFKGGNLVHYAHDCTWDFWTKYGHAFSMDHKPVEMEELLYKALRNHGVEVRAPMLTEDSYVYLYEKSGLSDYNTELSDTLRKIEDQDSRNYKINQLQEQLERKLALLTMDELLTIWHFECQNPDGGGGLNNALRAVCWDQSPVLLALGLQEPTRCQFLTAGKIQKQVTLALGDQDPHKKLQELVLASTGHQKVIKDPEGEGIPIWQCPECMDQLQNALVNHIRYKNTFDRDESLRRTTEAVNEFLRYLASGPGTNGGLTTDDSAGWE